MSAKTKSSSRRRKLPKPLTVKDVFASCTGSEFNFTSTKNVKTTQDIISQPRAVRSIEVGLGIRKPGYNIYVAGITGTGKTSVIKTYLEKKAADSTPPLDWIYVYNFKDTNRPFAISLEPGKGIVFKKDMEHLIKVLKEEIPNALQSEDYENAVNACIGQSNEQQALLFAELEQKAKKQSFQVKSTRMGIETIPIVEGRALTEKEYSKLSAKERKRIEQARSKLEPEVLEFARKVRSVELDAKAYVENLQKEIGKQVLEAVFSGTIEKYKKIESLLNYLNQVVEDVLENMLDFLPQEEAGREDDYSFIVAGPEQRDPFRKYRINVFVNHAETKHAPVIIETNPTYYNLFGKIEKNVEHGMYLTDFTMIYPGAVHNASGGYLVLNALDVFKNPSVWDTLKRVLKNRQGFIEDMGEQYSLLPTSGLRPEPIPLDLKVILIGNDEIYRILYDMDEDFQKIFKIKSDFDYRMPRNKANMKAYVSFIATRSKREELLPFDKTAVGAIIEHSSRLVENKEYLTTQFGEIKDLTIESDYIARESKARTIKRVHVEEAIEQKTHRVDLPEESIMDMVETGNVLLDVEGERVGQINGLAVYDIGDHAFGKPSRITCTSSFNDDGIMNVERAVKLSGNIHDKGLFILSGFLKSQISEYESLGFSASLTFEQNYGGVDGDSATIAELVVIVSALAAIPIPQRFAVTGSLNQFGDVQPVGGINEKIEGFYNTTRIIGKKGKYGVVIPHQNVANLMLNKQTRAAVRDKSLEIFPVTDIWEAFEVITGTPLGKSDKRSKTFAEDTALFRVINRLQKIKKSKAGNNDKDS